AIRDKFISGNFSLMEGKVFVNAKRKLNDVTENEDKLEYEDIILSIYGKSIENLTYEYSLFKSGSHKTSKYSWVPIDLLRDWNDIADIEVLRNNQKIKLKDKRYASPKYKPSETTPKIWELIDDNVGFTPLLLIQKNLIKLLAR